MYYKLSDFIKDLTSESERTIKIFSALTDESLKQKVYAGGRDIAYIAWHIVISVGEMMSKSGIKTDSPAEDSDPPLSANEILVSYKTAVNSLESEIPKSWTDETLEKDFDMYGGIWKGGFLLRVLVNHEIHHRAQLTVLMRQAGLSVPGIYGPAKEEWGQYGMPVAK